MRIAIAIALSALFVYSILAHGTARLFNRYDPSSNYQHGTNELLSDRDVHRYYIFLASILWPLSLSIWVLAFLPRRIALRVERYLDRPKSPETSNKVYR